MLYVSFHTGPGYDQEAAALQASLDALGLEHSIHERDDPGSWELACGMKPTFLRDMREAVEGPIVWLDADARVLAVPDWGGAEGGDLAVHLHKGHEILSGTIYVGDTPGAREILARWCALQAERPQVWDQRNLAHVLQGTDRRVFEQPRWDVRRLPVTHCQIHRAPTAEIPEGTAILHTQASRRLRERGA